MGHSIFRLGIPNKRKLSRTVCSHCCHNNHHHRSRNLHCCYHHRNNCHLAIVEIHKFLGLQGQDNRKLSSTACLHHHHSNHHHPIRRLHCCCHHRNNCHLAIEEIHILLAPQGPDIHKLSSTVHSHHHHSNHHHPIHRLHCCCHHHNNCHLAIEEIHNHCLGVMGMEEMGMEVLEMVVMENHHMSPKMKGDYSFFRYQGSYFII